MRGLFRDGPRNFEPWSDAKDATPTGGCLATTYDLACNRLHTRIFSGIGFQTCDPLVPRSRPYHGLNCNNKTERIYKIPTFFIEQAFRPAFAKFSTDIHRRVEKYNLSNFALKIKTNIGIF
ncbi:hypothetical protein AVEN_238060-1 [Araneus ventricosus]|uniref:Uncharacterized protein n=1 Tax=Araneus ventricosus TaxID=182803 RepID=A0A4Y2LGY7_ARAVE|nr:hypothetical protein AVEN_238060-1 [Araneus ventricosus]